MLVSKRTPRSTFAILVAAGALALSLLAPHPADALVAPMGLAELSRAADSVVVAAAGNPSARAVGQRVAGHQRAIVTDVPLHVGRVLLGNRPSAFTLTVPGGVVGNVGMRVSDTPSFSAGQHVVLFLDREGRIIGGEQGSVAVVGDWVPAFSMSVNDLRDAIARARASTGAGAGAAPTAVFSGAVTSTLASTGQPLVTAAVTPVITAISPGRTIAGIGSKVTISGYGFGAVQGAGSVDFIDGRGGSTSPPLKGTVSSWSDSQIVVAVPRYAAAGNVFVNTADGGRSGGFDYDVSFSTGSLTYSTPSMSYLVNENTADMSGVAAQIQADFATWNAAGSNFRFSYAGTTTYNVSPYSLASSSDGMNTIFFTNEMPTGLIAVNRQFFDNSTNKLIESDIAINDAETWVADASAYTGVGNVCDLQSVVLHELGHSVGLDDQYLDYAPPHARVMGAYVYNRNRRSLTQNEIDGAIYLYGTSGTPAPTPSPSPAPAPTPAPASGTAERVDGRDRWAVAAAVGARAFPNWTGVTDVVIANGEDRAAADPLAAAGLAGAYNGPVLLVSSRLVNGTVPAATEAALAGIRAANGGRVTIHVVGGTTSIPPVVFNRLAALRGGGGIERITGSDRYGLSVAIAQRVVAVLGAGNVPGVLIANGENPAAFYDALAASPVAFATHRPLLIVRSGGLPPSVAAELATTFAGKPRTAVNGVQYLPGTVAGQASCSERMSSSSDRYSSAVNIADFAIAHGWLAPTTTGLTNKLPDALTAGSALGRLGGPVLYTPASPLAPQTQAWLSARRPKLVLAAGGSISLSPYTLDYVNQLLN